jgi:tetratricopeptide (TPR) repeat protein
MPEDNDLYVFEIAVGDFDLSLIPEGARAPGSGKFDAAVKNFYEDHLRKIADSHNVAIEDGKIRVSWRKDSIRPDAIEEAVASLQKGDYAAGVQVLEFLLPSRADDAVVHFNLGMAYSDLGKLDQAVHHLQRALDIEKRMVNAQVALGVAYSRQKKHDEAAVVLKQAVLEDPDNGYALRNLGAVLMQLGRDKEDAVRYLKRATELLPEDQQAWYGLAGAQMETGDSASADESFIKVIEIQPFTPIAGTAKEMRSQIAQQNFRKASVGGLRMDAVMYCLGALKKFADMTPPQVQGVGFEIATLGMNGIDVNDPQSKYRLRTLPGTFTGSQLLCYEYVAFKQFAPELDIGFDVSKEYEEARRMKAMGL